MEIEESESGVRVVRYVHRFKKRGEEKYLYEIGRRDL
jgi:hypothetical protein